jgi:hypothetical protein
MDLHGAEQKVDVSWFGIFSRFLQQASSSQKNCSRIFVDI